MIDVITAGLLILVGILISYIIVDLRKKVWYLEVLSPRQQYEIGKEKKVISHLEIHGRHFHGVEAGKYKVMLLYGDISKFGKPILSGKLEEMYMKVLTKSFIGRGLVSKLERLKFWEFIHSHIPSLRVKAYLLTGELVSPQEVLDTCWSEKERTEALVEMRRRKLLSPYVLWVKPYPPEDQLKDVMTGVIKLPDIIHRHQEEYAQLIAEHRDILVKMDVDLAKLLKEVITLMRDIITSISDPIHVMSMIIADKARKIEGLGIEQLAERGGVRGVIDAAKMVRQYKDELAKALAEPLKQEDMQAIQEKLKKLDQLEKKIEELSKSIPKTAIAQVKE